MDVTNKEEATEFLPGIYASSTTSSLKSIANKPKEAYINRRREHVMVESVESDYQYRHAEVNTTTSNFSVQPFVGPISGRQTSHSIAVVAHGYYDRVLGRMVTEEDLLAQEAEVEATAKPPVVNTIIVDNSKPKQYLKTIQTNHSITSEPTTENSVMTVGKKPPVIQEPLFVTDGEEIMAPPTYRAPLGAEEVAKILKNSPEVSVSDSPIQGRLVFSTIDGDFEIEANLVRVKLENSDVYAQYDRQLADVLDEQFGKSKSLKPFTKLIEVADATEPVTTSEATVAQSEPEVLFDAFTKNAPTTNKESKPVAQPVEKEVPAKVQKPPVATEPVKNEPENLATRPKLVSLTRDKKEKPVPAVAKKAVKKEAVQEVGAFPKDFYYEFPNLNLLKSGNRDRTDNDEWAVEKMEILEQTFENFGVAVTVTGDFVQGATVTQFEIAPDPGTKVSRIKGLADDLKIALAVDDLRIEAITGKSTIGIEVANDERQTVHLKDVLSTPEFRLNASPLLVGLGEDITGAPVYADIQKMPHGLVAGQTGSGKSVCINTLLVSLLYKATPEQVRLLLIDPKQVEMAMYEDIPHLVTPVITDAKKAATALEWAVDEMERRYTILSNNKVRDIETFNEKRKGFSSAYEQMPYIVIVIDELADLMNVAAQDVEISIQRLTQKARAVGIHLILATQRPTVNVITGTIKSNAPTRIAFAVAQANDSRVILDGNGAEDLLGRGDMLFLENGNKIRRVQGAFVSDDEVMRVVNAAKKQAKPRYLIAEDALDKRLEVATPSSGEDEAERAAMELFITEQKASVSLLQRKLTMGYNRAAKLVDQLEEKGWISKPMGAVARREVLMTMAELDAVFSE